jgi:PKD repeat protein
MKRTILCMLFLFLSVPFAHAATYYVDPATGNNANAGAATGTAWKNPPGTRTTTNSGFISSTWGSISTSAKVQCGDTILLKGGSTQTSTQGGAWRIDNNYYTATCTTGSRITIRIATVGEWAGSTSNFIIDGTGVTPTCVNNCGSGGYDALVDVEKVNYIQLLGQSASQRIEIKNTPAGPAGASEYGMGLLLDNFALAQGDGFKAQWLSIHDNNGAGVEVVNWKNWNIGQVISFNNGLPGFGAGGQSDSPMTNGAFVDTEAYNNGTRAQPGFADAYFFLGGNPLWCVRCTAHDNIQRGFNTGTVSDAIVSTFLFRDMRAYGNGTSADPNIAKAGFGFSGPDQLDQFTQYNFIVGAVLYRNVQLGAWMGYGDGWVEMWHATMFGNGYGTNPDGDVKYDRSSDLAAVYNSIFQHRSYNPAPWTYGNANFARDRAPKSDYNVYHPASADTENFSYFNFQAGFSTTARTFAQAAAGQAGFTGAHDLIGLTYNPLFVATDDTTYASNDFHLQNGSPAIDHGQFLMRANGAGTSATTVTVLGNGNSNDPRNYFIGPLSYLDAVPDLIQIQGCGQVTITAITATTISFTPACSWVTGAGVHLAYNGAAPDSGAFEATVAPPAPVSNFTASPLSGTAPLAVQFSDTSTGGPTAWAWVFGDGGTSTLQSPAHSYAAAGTYTVQMTATNAGGSNTMTKTSYITVTTPAPPIGSITRTMMPREYFALVDPVKTRVAGCTAALLNTAITAAGSTVGTFWLPPMDGLGTACVWNTESNVTIPATLTLHIPSKAQICPATGTVFTVNGPIEGDLNRQIKGDNCPGKIVFGAPTSQLHAKWWGASFNGALVNKALADIGTGVKQLILDEGAWIIDTGVTVPATTTLILPLGHTCSATAAFDVQGPILDYTHLAKSIAGNVPVTVSGTAAETTLFSYVVNGCALSTHAGLRLTVLYDYLNATGALTNLTLRLKYTAGGVTSNAGTMVFTGLEQDATNRRPGRLELTLLTAGARNALRTVASGLLGPPVALTGAAGVVVNAGGLGMLTGNNLLVADSTGNNTLALTAQHSVSSANASVTLQSVLLELVSK